jgi:hypothetical protein
MCPSCQSEVEPLSGNICPRCAWTFDVIGAPIATLVKPARTPKIQVRVDLVFQIDRTGSSAEFSEGIPMAAELIIKPIQAKARELRCWVATHGDLDYDEKYVLLTDNGTPEQALDDIRKISYGGGGDAAETHLDGIEQTFHTIPWTFDYSARGAIVSFLTADTKKSRSGVTAAELGRHVREKNLLFYAVCQETPALRELADAAGGLLFPISNAPSSETMQLIASQIAASITNTAASGGTLTMPMAS